MRAGHPMAGGTALAVAVALLTAGCGSSGAPTSSSTATSAADSTTTTPGLTTTVSVAPNTTEPLPTLTFGSYTGIEPTTIDLSGDAGNVITSIKWSEWTYTEAIGAGTRNIQGCVPDCAQGSETPEPTTVYFSDVVGGRYTMMQEDTRGQPPYDQSLPGRYEGTS